jgi:hypothetical protein
VLARSNAFSAFVHAAPGARELITITKAWELGRRTRWDRRRRGYDLVVVDGPASGHGLGMLRTPHTFAEIARVGPIASQAREVDELLRDPSRSAILTVALPAELPVSETLDLEGRVRDALRRDVDAIVVNGVLPRRFSGEDVAQVAAVDGAAPSAVLAAVRSHHGQAVAQQAQLRRLRAGAGAAGPHAAAAPGGAPGTRRRRRAGRRARAPAWLTRGRRARRPPARRLLDSQPVQEPLVRAPATAHPHGEVQVDAIAELALELAARGDADRP